ncbi:MAG TPA: lysine biosynthesis protein LysW [Anaerolineae bacterium]|nr:lysine biosynthesis protein LysW [Anaerolineae bacterium]
MAKGYCPECDVTINLGKSPRKGQRISCFKCGSQLEVVGLSPIELDWAYDEDPDLRMDDDIDQEYTGG